MTKESEMASDSLGFYLLYRCKAFSQCSDASSDHISFLSCSEWSELKVWIWPGADIAHLHRNYHLYVGMWTYRLPLTTCLTVC